MGAVSDQHNYTHHTYETRSPKPKSGLRPSLIPQYHRKRVKRWLQTQLSQRQKCCGTRCNGSKLLCAISRRDPTSSKCAVQRPQLTGAINKGRNPSQNKWKSPAPQHAQSSWPSLLQCGLYLYTHTKLGTINKVTEYQRQHLIPFLTYQYMLVQYFF